MTQLRQRVTSLAASLTVPWREDVLARFLISVTALVIPTLGIAQQGGEYRIMTLRSEPSCGGCRIELVGEELLRPPPDSVWFDRTTMLLRLPSGGTVASMKGTASPIVYDASGRYVKSLMRDGDGPGEVRIMGMMAIGPGDSLWVVDTRKRVLTVFTPSLTVARTRSGVGFGGLSSVVTRSGEVVFAASIPTPERAGLPIHVTDSSGTIVRSFGRDDPAIDPRTPDVVRVTGMMREIQRASDSSVWVYNPSTFLLELWSKTGVRMAKVEHARDGWYGELSRSRPAGSVSSVHPLATVQTSNEPGVLWLLYIVRRDAASAPRDELPHRGFDLIVEAVDTRSWRVLAMRRFVDVVYRPVVNAPDVIAVVTPLDGDLRTFRMSRLQLNRP